jgi:hypothetical protein
MYDRSMQTDPRRTASLVVKLPAREPGYPAAVILDEMNIDRSELGDDVFDGVVNALIEAKNLLEERLGELGLTLGAS